MQHPPPPPLSTLNLKLEIPKQNKSSVIVYSFGFYQQG